MKQKKVPVRMCVACRTGRPKKELLRVVNTQEGVVTDTTGKASGRGAYLCPDVACLDKALKTRAINRALECELSPESAEAIRRIILRRDIER